MPYGVQPGLSVDGTTPIASVGDAHRVVASVRATGFVRPQTHTSLQLGTELGVHLRADRTVSHLFSIGPHAQLTSQLLGRSIDISTGGNRPDRQWRGYVVPLVRYRLIHQPTEKLSTDPR